MSIIGLGGVFIRPQNRDILLNWYQQNVGIPDNDWGQHFTWNHPDAQIKEMASVFSIFKQDSNYIPLEKTYMINFMVSNMNQFIQTLKDKGVPILGEETNEFGSFAWIEDPEKNKIE